MIRGRSMSDANLVLVDYLAHNLAVSQTAVALPLSGATGVTAYSAPGPGWIIAISVNGSANVTAGTNAFTPTINGAKVTGIAANDLGVSIASGTKAVTGAAQLKTEVAFKKGDTIGVAVDTNGSFAPNGSADYAPTLLLGFDVVSKND